MSLLPWTSPHHNTAPLPVQSRPAPTRLPASAMPSTHERRSCHASARMQGGRFDHADRLFFSLPVAWAQALTSTSDVKEMVPELFYQPACLRNDAALPLGTRQAGQAVGDVELPPWAHGCPHEFIRIHRCAVFFFFFFFFYRCVCAGAALRCLSVALRAAFFCARSRRCACACTRPRTRAQSSAAFVATGATLSARASPLSRPLPPEQSASRHHRRAAL